MFNIGENICWNKYYVKLFPYNSLQERDGRKDTVPSTDCPWTPLLIRDIETSMDCPSGVRDTLIHSPLSAIRRLERRAEGTPFSALHRWTLTPPPKLTTRLRHCFACACDGSLLYLVLVWVSVVEIRCLLVLKNCFICLRRWTTDAIITCMQTISGDIAARWSHRPTTWH